MKQGHHGGCVPAPLAISPVWYRIQYYDVAQLAALTGYDGFEQHFSEHGWLEGCAGTEHDADAEG